MSKPTGTTVRFLATNPQWRIVENADRTLGVLAPLLSERTFRSLLKERSHHDVLEDLALRTSFAAFTHAPHEGFRLHTDLNRSFPLYWRRQGDLIEASDDHRVLTAAPGDDRSSTALEEFSFAGFTVGTRTLHDGIHCAPADAEVRLDSTMIRPQERSRISLPGPGPVTDAEEAGAQFFNALRSAVDDLVSENPDAHFLLPLSGGSDSRLLATAVHDVAPARLTAFTYGTGGAEEVRTSRQVAAALGIPWVAIELSVPEIRRRWRAPENASFLALAHGGNALPHVQDWFAISTLREQSVVGPDAIVLPGHTAARSYTPPRTPVEDGGWDRDTILDTVLAQHFNQRGATPTHEPVRSQLVPALLAELPLAQDRFDEISTARLIQTFNIQHRQVKYILNSVRVYEHFSARWAMPLLDGRCHRVLDTIDWEIRRSKDWYRTLTDREMRRVAGDRADGLELAAADGAARPGSGPVHDTLGRSVHRLTTSARSVLTNLHHPLAFEAYAPSRRDYVRSIAHRFSPLGVFAQAFLDGSWNPQYDWDDESTWSTPSVISVSEFSVSHSAP